jgi:hypothetical protein
MRITGTWQGQYKYGEDYQEDTGTSVPFRLSLRQSWWFGRVRGHVRDDVSKGGQPELGLVDGWRKGTVVRFVKVMPVAYAMVDGRLTPFRDLLQQQGFTVLGELPHRIGYRGTVRGDGRTMDGDWQILPEQVETDRGWIEVGSGSGTWSAQQVDRRCTTLRRSDLPL